MFLKYKIDKMENLISMTDYVLEQTKIETSKMQLGGVAMALHKINEYARFLSMPLELKMFVPCDSENNVLEEPKNYKQWLKKALNTPYDLDLSKYEKYQEGESEVIFEGFEWYEGIRRGFAKKDFDYVGAEFCEDRKIEDVVREFDNLKLTPNAKLKYKF